MADLFIPSRMNVVAQIGRLSLVAGSEAGEDFFQH